MIDWSNVMGTRTRFFQNCLGVFQGGGCRAAAYVGAYKEATARGVSFSEVVGTSAGAIVASLIGAGATADGLEKIIHRLNFKDLVRPPQPLPSVNSSLPFFFSIPPLNKLKPIISGLGIHSSSEIQSWLEKELLNLLPGATSPVKFKHLKIPTTVVATDILTQKIKIWSTTNTPDDDVAYAVRTSCSIPIFFQPVDIRYVDGGVLSNLPSFAFSEDYFNKVLAFSLVSECENRPIDSPIAFLNALVNSVVDGAQDIQLSLQKNIHLIPIPSGTVKATDFDITNEKVKILIDSGKKAMENFIDNEVIKLKQGRVNTNICYSHAQSYYQIAQSFTDGVSEIIIAEISTDWVYDLYLTLLHWVQCGAKISVVLDKSDDKRHGAFRVRILESLGINVTFVDEIPIRCFLINPDDQINSLAIVRRLPGIVCDDFDAILYESPNDNQVIRSIARLLDRYRANKKKDEIPSIISVENELSINALKRVSQYLPDYVNVYVSEINIKKIRLLSNYIRGYKYRQIHHLFDLYSQRGIGKFRPAAIKYGNNKETLIGLPVLEKWGDNYYLIDGNTRVTFCHRQGIESIYALVAEGVTQPLPATGYYSASEMIVTDKVVSGASRYDGFDKKHYRYIDAAFRDPSTCLL